MERSRWFQTRARGPASPWNHPSNLCGGTNADWHGLSPAGHGPHELITGERWTGRAPAATDVVNQKGFNDGVVESCSCVGPHCHPRCPAGEEAQTQTL